MGKIFANRAQAVRNGVGGGGGVCAHGWWDGGWGNLRENREDPAPTVGNCGDIIAGRIASQRASIAALLWRSTVFILMRRIG